MGSGPYLPGGPAAAGRPRSTRRQATIRWVVGLIIVALFLLLLAKSIPAAQRPTLGPPSTPARTLATTTGGAPVG